MRAFLTHTLTALRLWGERNLVADDPMPELSRLDRLDRGWKA